MLYFIARSVKRRLIKYQVFIFDTEQEFCDIFYMAYEIDLII